MSLPLRPPLITWVSGATSLDHVVRRREQPGELDRVGAGGPVLLRVGLVPDLDEVHLAVDVPHDVADEARPAGQLGVGARRLADRAVGLVQRPARHGHEAQPHLQARVAGRRDDPVHPVEAVGDPLDRLHRPERRGRRDDLGARLLGQRHERADLLVAELAARGVAGRRLHAEVDQRRLAGRRSSPRRPRRWRWAPPGVDVGATGPGRLVAGAGRGPDPDADDEQRRGRRRRRRAAPPGRSRRVAARAATASAARRRPRAATAPPGPPRRPSRSASPRRDRPRRRGRRRPWRR